jgi:chemotaxis protein methyltransferase CheR
MHRLMAGITILEHELSELRLLLERQTGILLDCPNSALAAHLADYLERNELDSSAALLGRLRSGELDAMELTAFLDGIMNVNTGFFRHPGAMNTLTRQVLPQIFARKVSDGPATLRIWSAGCATGEEPYSIAMAVCEALSGSNGNGTTTGSSNGNGNGNKEPKVVSKNGGVSENGVSAANPCSSRDWAIHIIGTDLLPSSIQIAERGVYPQSALAGLPPAAIRSCFSKVSPNGGSNGTPETNGNGNGLNGNGLNGASANGNGNGYLLVKPRLRSLVTFNTMNLTKPVYIGRFDCIFCMDVLPHLSRSQRAALMERLHLYLEPGGYLFLSQTEKLCAPNLNFRPESYDGYTFYRKPLAAAAAYGR